MAMTVIEAIELFKSEMMGEIFQSSASEELQDALIEAVKEVEKTVTDTYKTSLKQQPK